MNLVQKFSRYEIKGKTNIVLAICIFLSMIYITRSIAILLWPQTIQNNETFSFTGAVLLHTVVQIVSFLIFLPGYLNISPYYQKHRINKKSALNWQRNNWSEMRMKIIKNLVLNHLIVYPLFVFLNRNRLRVRFHDFPSFSEVVWQVILIYFIQDFFFYWGHRAFHSFTTLYKMHKIHHEFDTLFTWVTQYFHPFDFIVANVLPSALGVMFLGQNIHCFTYFYWIGWKILISTQGHSGYEFPWSPMRVLPLVTGPSYHDHHHSSNVGNFAGSCYFWDLMFNTNEQYMNAFLKPKAIQQKND